MDGITANDRVLLNEVTEQLKISPALTNAVMQLLDTPQAKTLHSNFVKAVNNLCDQYKVTVSKQAIASE